MCSERAVDALEDALFAFLMMALVAVIEGAKFKVSKMHALQLVQKALGFVCGRGTIGVDPDKTEAILQCPRPTRPGHTDSFLCGTSFIRNHCLPQYAQLNNMDLLVYL